MSSALACEGVLQVRAKKGPRKLRRWLKRWFVLDVREGALLRYHKFEDALRHSDDCRKYFLEEMESVREELPPRIYIEMADGDTVKLKARDYNDAQKWLMALQFALQRYQRSKRNRSDQQTRETFHAGGTLTSYDPNAEEKEDAPTPSSAFGASPVKEGPTVSKSLNKGYSFPAKKKQTKKSKGKTKTEIVEEFTVLDERL